MIVENGDGFLRKCLGHLADNPPPCLYGEITEFLHSDEKANPGSFYFLIIVIERSDIF
ncbi:MAG: hypothetical protein ACD_71C00223G0001, partial [uncultured bacterium (gcode 4)]